jgi:hypothetical protein
MDADTKIAVHEAVCAERYKAIEDRLSRGQKKMDRIQLQLNLLLVAVLFGPGVAMDLIKRFLGVP